MNVPLPLRIPLFPLPNVVLFPQVLLPLHIFEPRYRLMVREVAEGDELIGMVLLRGEEGSGRPGEDVYPVGCSGRLIRKAELADGRSNILLQGIREFSLREQYFDRPYRSATVEWRAAPERDFRLDGATKVSLLEGIRSFAGKEGEGDLRILADPMLSDEMLVNLFAFALDFPVAEKQGLLETEGLAKRAARLVETLEFHNLARGCVPGVGGAKLRVQ
jgi:Lon protease-like protein